MVEGSGLKVRAWVKAQLSFYETELLSEQNKKQNFDSLKIYDYQQKLFSYNYQYEELIKELERDYPSYFYLKYQVVFRLILS